MILKTKRNEFMGGLAHSNGHDRLRIYETKIDQISAELNTEVLGNGGQSQLIAHHFLCGHKYQIWEDFVPGQFVVMDFSPFG